MMDPSIPRKLSAVTGPWRALRDVAPLPAPPHPGTVGALEGEQGSSRHSHRELPLSAWLPLRRRHGRAAGRRRPHQQRLVRLGAGRQGVRYEWADGFTARFGLVAADYATQQRTIRESARRLAEIS